MFIGHDFGVTSATLAGEETSEPQGDRKITFNKEDSDLLKKLNVFANEGDNVDCDQEGADKINALLKHLKEGTPLSDDDNLALAALQNAFPDPTKAPTGGGSGMGLTPEQLKGLGGLAF